MNSPVTAIIGVGSGNGAAFARRFAAEGHRVALLSRSLDALKAMAETIDGEVRAFACDASDPEAVAQALAQVEAELGPVDHLLYNAGSGVFGSIDEVSEQDLEMAWRINALGLFAAAKAVLPKMRERGAGSIIVTGATASLRGGARFLAFAQAKAAQRNVAQALARQVGPEGIHVALVIVDGVIDMDRSRSMMPNMPADKLMKPEHIAESMWFLTQQPRTAWTFELDLRPYGEKW